MRLACGEILSFLDAPGTDLCAASARKARELKVRVSSLFTNGIVFRSAGPVRVPTTHLRSFMTDKTFLCHDHEFRF